MEQKRAEEKAQKAEERAQKAVEKAKIAEERPELKAQKRTHKRVENSNTGNGEVQEKKTSVKRKTDSAALLVKKL